MILRAHLRGEVGLGSISPRSTALRPSSIDGLPPARAGPSAALLNAAIHSRKSGD
jgi:hypothetical protein